MVNATDTELYVWTSTAPADLAATGVSAPDIFLLGRPDPRRLAAQPRSRYLLRLAVGPGGAVPLAEYTTHLPASMQYRAREAAGIYVLPTSWLMSSTACGYLELDPDGHLVEVHTLPGVPMRVSFQDADHGVPGLPSSAVRWPAGRGLASAHLLVPLDADERQAHLAATPGWVPINAKRPVVAKGWAGHEVQVPPRVAVDIRRTRAMLSQTPVVADSLAALWDHEIALPTRAFRRTTVTRVYSTRGTSSPDRDVRGRRLWDVLSLDAAGQFST